MRSRLTIRTFVVSGAVLCVAALAVSAAAQPAPVRIVQGSNGALYVLQGDKSWTLVPDQINDADVAALSLSGEIDGTLPGDVLMVQPPAAAPAPPAAPPPAPAPAPAPAAPAAPVASGPPQLAILNPLENQNVSAKGGASYTITGTAADPVGGAGAIDLVDVWIFGERNAPGATHLGVATFLSDGTWSMSFLPTRFTSTHTNIYVYAHSKTTGLETTLSRGFNIIG